MKTKYKLQVVQDFILLIILMSLMGFHLWSENIHEWLGIIFLAIILIHNGLNVSWFKKVFDGGHSAFRMMQIAVNIILALFFFTAIASGLMLSRHVVPDLPIHNATDFVRKIHMTSVHWIQIIIAIHLGMHWKMLANFFCKIWRIEPFSFFATRFMPAVFIGLSLYGVAAFIHRDMYPYLLWLVDFAFFDYEESKILFYVDYFAVTLFFAYLIRIVLWFFLFRKSPTT